MGRRKRKYGGRGLIKTKTQTPQAWPGITPYMDTFGRYAFNKTIYFLLSQFVFYWIDSIESILLLLLLRLSLDHLHLNLLMISWLVLSFNPLHCGFWVEVSSLFMLFLSKNRLNSCDLNAAARSDSICLTLPNRIICWTTSICFWCWCVRKCPRKTSMMIGNQMNKVFLWAIFPQASNSVNWY